MTGVASPKRHRMPLGRISTSDSVRSPACGVAARGGARMRRVAWPAKRRRRQSRRDTARAPVRRSGARTAARTGAVGGTLAALVSVPGFESSGGRAPAPRRTAELLSQPLGRRLDSGAARHAVAARDGLRSTGPLPRSRVNCLQQGARSSRFGGRVHAPSLAEECDALRSWIRRNACKAPARRRMTMEACADDENSRPPAVDENGALA
jgi:hypothetical protein